ncbi:MAG TPA: AbrB/MazE/SpoVT family DNA-binding domain-containing protein [Candidatus Limnocylindria bacterium]|nr:AbrB/MazE/SpoVT family DNA-binding domain-containing protein [Candidatus Limnocylindria bacterium]
MKTTRAPRRAPRRRAGPPSAAAPAGAGRIVTLRPNGQITLPAELRQRVGAKTGDVFVAEVNDDAVVLRPKRLIDASQAWFWTPEWQKMEREADADIKAGRVKRFRDVEDLIADLDA